MNQKQSVKLKPLTDEDREFFIVDNQEAFHFGAMKEFGIQDGHFEEDGEVISRETIEKSIDEGTAFRIMQGRKAVGGLVVKVSGERGDLEILFVNPDSHSRGIGQAAWQEVEKIYPEVKVWETVTPYFEKRNIHFYVNRCGFHIVEFFHSLHPNLSDISEGQGKPSEEMFRFEKVITQ